MVPNQLEHFSHWPLRLGAGYMLVAGVSGLLWPLLPFGPNNPEFQARSRAFKAGAYARELTLAAVSAVAGVGLFGHHAWARTLALGLLLFGSITMYRGNAFAWGFSGGPPTLRVRIFSYIAVAAWNGIWFYLIYRFAP